MVCGALTLGTLAWAVSVLAVSTVTSVPGWSTGPVLQVLLTGAVGYGTNFLAVQMLFKPHVPRTSIPMRWVWRQGLVPARQAALAERVGHEVATRLLPQEELAAELAELLERAMGDAAWTAQLREMGERVLGGSWAESLAPAVGRSLQEALARPAYRERLLDSLSRAVDARLQDEAAKGEVAEALRQWLRSQSPRLVKRIKKAADTYSSERGVGWATRNLVDWDAVEDTFRRQLRPSKGSQWLHPLVDGLRPHVGALLSGLLSADDLGGTLGAVLSEDSGVVREVLDDPVLQQQVLDAFWPPLEDELVAWVHGGALRDVLTDLDIEGRVVSAVERLDPVELEHVANEVAAQHLGAIQVLGYVLGLLAGGLLVAISAVS